MVPSGLSRDRGSARWQGQISQCSGAIIKRRNVHLNEIRSRWVVSYLKQENDMIQLTFQKDHSAVGRIDCREQEWEPGADL